MKLRQTFYFRSLGFDVYDGVVLSFFPQGIVSEAQAYILLSLTLLYIDRELQVNLRQTFYSRSLGFVSTGNCD